ncbi:MAG: GNAT family N-acetyltransferase, partial [Theionarchaea archaeon]|nr:GNAT family N-acetyltransferase [Theionarchaea archaeon]
MMAESEEEKVTAYETCKGTVFIKRKCSCKFISSHQMDEGIGTFFRFNEGCRERQRKLFLDIAIHEDEEVLLAYTEGLIIGGITVLHPGPNERWGKIGDPRIYEMGSIEVSTNWRGLGVARKMLEWLFTDGFYDDKIVYSMELAWHWDFKHTPMSKFEYRDMLLKLFQSVGFVQLDTDEPDVLMDSANMLTVRFGKDTDQELRDTFWYSLFERGDY